MLPERIRKRIDYDKIINDLIDTEFNFKETLQRNNISMNVFYELMYIDEFRQKYDKVINANFDFNERIITKSKMILDDVLDKIYNDKNYDVMSSTAKVMIVEKVFKMYSSYFQLGNFKNNALNSDNTDKDNGKIIINIDSKINDN